MFTAPSQHTEILGAYGLLANISVVVPRGASSETTLFVSPVHIFGPSPLMARSSDTRTHTPWFADPTMVGDMMLDISILDPDLALGLYGLARLGCAPILAAVSVRLVGSSSENTAARLLLCPLDGITLRELASRASAGTWEHRSMLRATTVFDAMKPLTVGPELIARGCAALDDLFDALLPEDSGITLPEITPPILRAIATATTGYAARPVGDDGPCALAWALPVAGSAPDEFPVHRGDRYLGYDWDAILAKPATAARFDAILERLHSDLAILPRAIKHLIASDLEPKFKDLVRFVKASEWKVRDAQLYLEFYHAPRFSNSEYPVHLDLARSGPMVRTPGF